MAIVGAMVKSAGLGRNRSLNDVIVSWNNIMTDPVREMAYAPLYNKNGNPVQEAAVSARSVHGGGACEQQTILCCRNGVSSPRALKSAGTP